VANGGKMKAHPFLINKDSTGQRLEPIDIQEKAYDETWLQNVLRLQPEILPVAEIESIFYPLVPIGREVAAGTGAIDNLFISHRGYLVLVETKLWRNPEAKREVVAQAIDYGSSLSNWNYDRLNEVVKGYTKKFENNELDLADWVEKRCGPMEGGRSFFEETVVKNLRLGRFLTLIVGDRIRQSVIEMLNYYGNKYPHLATDIALVELYCYRWTSKGESWSLLVVPNIVARTEIVERSIVQVTVSPAGTYQIESQQEKAKLEMEGRKRVTLTEEAFWELLKKQSPNDYDGIHNLIDKYRARDGVEIDPTEKGIAVRLYIQDTGQQAALFFVNTNAEVWVWPETVRRQLEKAGFDRNLADSYRTQIRHVFELPEKRVEFGRPVRQVNIEKFTSTVDAFIQNIQLAKPINN